MGKPGVVFENMKSSKTVQFYPQGSERATDYIIIPRNMVEGEAEIALPNGKNWNRVCAYGIVAVIAHTLFKKGATLFKLAKARGRENSFEGDEGEMVESWDIIAKEFAGDEAKKIKAKLLKDGYKSRTGAPSPA
ncbi:MAG: hypothetical protein JRJ14_10405 [Deltaproteobacteria bacterium]|nr:hypothetical protein [Deltaproteobacteria bacterium]